MENLSLDDVEDESFGLLGDSLDDMEVEPELKAFLKKEMSVKDEKPRAADEEEEEEKEKKKKKKKWEEMSTVSAKENKDSLPKKLLSFKAGRARRRQPCMKQGWT